MAGQAGSRALGGTQRDALAAEAVAPERSSWRSANWPLAFCQVSFWQGLFAVLLARLSGCGWLRARWVCGER